MRFQNILGTAFLAAALIAPGFAEAQSMVFDPTERYLAHQELVRSYEWTVSTRTTAPDQYPVEFEKYFMQYMKYGEIDPAAAAPACFYWVKTRKERRGRQMVRVAASALVYGSLAETNLRLSEMALDMNAISLCARLSSMSTGN